MKHMQVMTNTQVPYDSQWVLRCTVQERLKTFKPETFLFTNSSWGGSFSAKLS